MNSNVFGIFVTRRQTPSPTERYSGEKETFFCDIVVIYCRICGDTETFCEFTVFVYASISLVLPFASVQSINVQQPSSN